MNIFVLSKDPNEAARMLCDKHVVKMHVESIQMLVSALRRWLPATTVRRKDGELHRGGYHNHPCTRWTGDSLHNFQWLTRHTAALCHEHEFRYGKVPYSKMQLDQVLSHYNPLRRLMLAHGAIDRTDFVLAMPDKYKYPISPVRSYRTYYKHDKIQFAEWSRGRDCPLWMYPRTERIAKDD